MVRKIQLERFLKDPNAFCNAEMQTRYLLSRPSYRSGSSDPTKVSRDAFFRSLEDGKLEQLAEEVASKDKGLRENYPWEKALIASDAVRLAVSNHIEARTVTGVSRTHSLGEAIALLEADRCDLKVERRAGDNRLTSSNNSLSSVNQYAKRYACLELLGVLSFSNCDKAFATVQRLSVVETGATTGAEIYQRVLGDPRYDQGLKVAALRMARKVGPRITPTGDLFSDLKSSFVESGSSVKNAEEMAWNTAALLATAGPNVASRLAYFPSSTETIQKHVALTTIAAVLPILDHRSSKAGNLFSFPPGVNGRCNTGKSYHFWFTAYLARRAALEGSSPLAAAAVAYQAEKFYQFGIRTESEQKNSGHDHSPSSEIRRGDLAYASAGAAYGAYAASGSKIRALDVDANMATLIAKAGEGSAPLLTIAASIVSHPLLEVYRGFDERFSPNVAFGQGVDIKFPPASDKSYLDFEESTPPTPGCP